MSQSPESFSRPFSKLPDYLRQEATAATAALIREINSVPSLPPPTYETNGVNLLAQIQISQPEEIFLRTKNLIIDTITASENRQDLTAELVYSVWIAEALRQPNPSAEIMSRHYFLRRLGFMPPVIVTNAELYDLLNGLEKEWRKEDISVYVPTYSLIWDDRNKQPPWHVLLAKIQLASNLQTLTTIASQYLDPQGQRRIKNKRFPQIDGPTQEELAIYLASQLAGRLQKPASL